MALFTLGRAVLIFFGGAAALLPHRTTFIESATPPQALQSPPQHATA